MNISERVHWVRITCKAKYAGGDVLETYKWVGLPFKTRMKFDWYFKYRAALLQVKFPKDHIEFLWGSEPAVGKTLEKIVSDRIQSKKNTIKKYENKLQFAIANWNELFPITDDPDYEKVIAKINRLKVELQEYLNNPEIIIKKYT